MSHVNQVPSLSDFSPVCILFTCRLTCPDWLNAWSHTWHLYGFCPLWILLWWTRWPVVLNCLLQTSHSYGFSPVWVRLWTSRSLAHLNTLSQCVHCAPRFFDNWLLPLNVSSCAVSEAHVACRFAIRSLWCATSLRDSASLSANQYTGSAYLSHTHRRSAAFFSGTTRVSRYQKGEPIWILLKQETVSGSGINWAICKSAPRSKNITMPAPHRFVFYRLDALSAAPYLSLRRKSQI